VSRNHLHDYIEPDFSYIFILGHLHDVFSGLDYLEHYLLFHSFICFPSCHVRISSLLRYTDRRFQSKGPHSFYEQLINSLMTPLALYHSLPLRGMKVVINRLCEMMSLHKVNFRIEREIMGGPIWNLWWRSSTCDSGHDIKGCAS